MIGWGAFFCLAIPGFSERFRLRKQLVAWGGIEPPTSGL